MSVATNELIEVYVKDGKTTVDTQGERRLGSDDCFVLASRLIDAGVSAEGQCPLRPFGDQIVVRVIYEGERVTGGGVHIPDPEVYKVEPGLRGVVLAVGPKVGVSPEGDFIEAPQVGDLVLFSRHAGIETVVGDKRYLTMKASYALMKIVLDASKNDGD